MMFLKDAADQSHSTIFHVPIYSDAGRNVETFRLQLSDGQKVELDFLEKCQPTLFPLLASLMKCLSIILLLASIAFNFKTDMSIAGSLCVAQTFCLLFGIVCCQTTTMDTLSTNHSSTYPEEITLLISVLDMLYLLLTLSFFSELVKPLYD
jgi:hypothetical protein